MKATPDNTVILHWDEGATAWSRLSWCDWVRFRGLGEGNASMLVGAAAGEHYFLVCVLGSRGELCSAIPHRYIMTTDARLVHGFDGLEPVGLFAFRLLPIRGPGQPRRRSCA